MENNFGLSRESLQRICPMAFKTEPTNPDVSTAYVVATTITIIEDMAALGWFPITAWQQKPRKANGIYSFHMVAFENPTLNNEEKDYYPRIILTNSHDGQHAFRFMVSLWRKRFGSNSLGIIFDYGHFESLYIRHIAYTFEELRTLTNTVAENLPEQMEMINIMTNTHLTSAQKNAFTVSMFKIRRGLPANIPFSLPQNVIDEILEPDKYDTDTLWDIFNILQAKLIEGGFYAASDPNKKPRKMRLIKSAARNIEVSRKLFKAAEKYLPMEEVEE